MEFRITTLIENMPDDRGQLQFEHGLSLYIEFDGKNLLFDTGQTGAFLENAKKCGKSLSEVDDVIISHGHYDHAGGVRKTLPHLKKTARMYVGEEFFRPKYKKLENGEYHYNGVDFNQNQIAENGISCTLVKEPVTYLTDHIILFKNFERTNEFEQPNPRFFVKEKGEMLPDLFPDEIALGLVTSKGLVILLGCSHVGAVNIVSAITQRTQLPVYAVLGGTHLVEADQERLEKTAQKLKDTGLSYLAVSHCTGERGIEYLQKEFGSRFLLNHTGNVFERQGESIGRTKKTVG